LFQNIYKKKRAAAIALICATCLLASPLISIAPALASEPGLSVTGSGLIFVDYTVYAQDSQRILNEIYTGDLIRVVARFEKPASITFTSGVAIKGVLTGGAFTGGVDSVVLETTPDQPGQRNNVTVTLNLRYTGGRATQLMFSLSGSRSIANGDDYLFDDPRNINIRQCIPEEEGGTDAVQPSGPSEPPKFAVDISARFPAANAGRPYVLEIPIKNVGKQAAKDIVVSIDPGEASGFPFEYDKYSMTSRMSELTVNSVRNARFELNVLPTAADGQHSVKVSISGRSVLGVNSLAESSETILIKINNTNTAPKLTLERISLAADANRPAQRDAADGNGYDVIERVDGAPPRLNAVKPGTSFLLTLHVRNSGSLQARDVALAIRGLKADGISTNNTPSTRYMSRIDGMSDATQTFELICAEEMSGERTELSLAITYKDAAGKDYTGDAQIFIPLEQAEKPSQSSTFSSFEFSNITSPKGDITEGANFSISFDIENTGEVPMEDIKLTYSAGTEIMGRSLNTRMLKPIPPGSKTPVSFDFTVSKISASGNVPIGFTVDYRAGEQEQNAGAPTLPGGTGGAQAARYTATQYVGIQLYKPEESSTTTETTSTTGKESVPKIIISKYEYSPKEAKAGQTVDITLSFYNTSMTQEVQNIKIQLDSDVESSGAASASSGVFTPVEGSNSFYIETIGPRQEVERSITLMIKGDADAKSYQLFSNIEYEDSKANAITTKESISIPVTQVTKVTISDIMISTPAIYTYQPFNVSYTFINMGKTTLYNVMASVDGPFTGVVQGYYAGNMQPGAQDFYDVDITPEFGGDQIGYALITYEDAQGGAHEERLEFPYFAMDMADFGDMGMIDWGDENRFGDYEGLEIDRNGEDGEGILGVFTSVWNRVVELANEAAAFAAGNPMLVFGVCVCLLIIIIIIVSLVRRSRHKRLERELNRMAENELDARGEGGDPARRDIKTGGGEQSGVEQSGEDQDGADDFSTGGSSAGGGDAVDETPPYDNIERLIARFGNRNVDDGSYNDTDDAVVLASPYSDVDDGPENDEDDGKD